jgi:hypothetical protein
MQKHRSRAEILAKRKADDERRKTTHDRKVPAPPGPLAPMLLFNPLTRLPRQNSGIIIIRKPIRQEVS